MEFNSSDPNGALYIMGPRDVCVSPAKDDEAKAQSLRLSLRSRMGEGRAKVQALLLAVLVLVMSCSAVPSASSANCSTYGSTIERIILPASTHYCRSVIYAYCKRCCC
jgi:hypothetical protein